jgi:ubiquitin-protein ligase
MHNRLTLEYGILHDNPLDGITLIVDEGNTRHWTVSIQGPKDSPYCEDFLTLEVDYPNQYPKCSPIFSFTSPLYHSHLETGKKISVPEVDWAPNVPTRAVIERIRDILLLPSHLIKNGPFNEKFEGFRSDPMQYFTAAAHFHHFPRPVTPELVDQWKKKDTELLVSRNRITQEMIFELDIVPLFHLFPFRIPWKPEKNYIFPCPAFQRVIMTLLCINKHHPNSYLGWLPKVLVLEILEYVTSDFFTFENMQNQGAFLDSVVPLRNAFHSFRKCQYLEEEEPGDNPDLITVNVKTVRGVTHSFRLRRTDVIYNVKLKLEIKTGTAVEDTRIFLGGMPRMNYHPLTNKMTVDAFFTPKPDPAPPDSTFISSTDSFWPSWDAGVCL